MNDVDDLRVVSQRLLAMADCMAGPDVDLCLVRIRSAAKHFGDAWSGSRLGYHARVYQDRFARPLSRDKFDHEWGLTDAAFRMGWREYPFDVVVTALLDEAGQPDWRSFVAKACDAHALFETTRTLMIERLAHVTARDRGARALAQLLEQIRDLRLVDVGALIERWVPAGTVMSKDNAAMKAGPQRPPHLEVLAQAHLFEMTRSACKELGTLVLHAADWFVRRQLVAEPAGSGRTVDATGSVRSQTTKR